MNLKLSNLKPHTAALGIFFTAFILRYLHLAILCSKEPFLPLYSDLQYYDASGWEIARGAVTPFNRPFFRAPLYSYFLAFIYKIFGRDYFTAMYIQIVIGSVSCVLLYLMGKKLFDRRAGVLAGFIAATYGIFIYYDADFEALTLEVFLTLLFLFSLFRFIERPSYRSALVSGLMASVTSLQRPNILAFVIILPIFFAKYLAKKVSTEWIVKYSAVFLFHAFLFTGLLGLRHYVLYQDPVGICYHGGLNFYLGNNPDANGAVPYMPGMGGYSFPLLHEMAEKESGRVLNYSEESDFWFKKGMDFVLGQPAKAALLMGKKFIIFWNGYEPKNNRDIYIHKRFSALLDRLIWEDLFGIRVPFGVLAPFGLFGMAVAFRRRGLLLLLYAYVFVYMATVVAFFVGGRMRAPVVPYLALFAAFGILWFVDRIKTRDKYLQLYLSLLLVLLFLINFGAPGKVSEPELNLGYPQATRYLEKGEYAKAIREFEAAVARNPYNPYYPTSLAQAYLRSGQTDKALDLLKRTSEKFPSYMPAKQALKSIRTELNKS